MSEVKKYVSNIFNMLRNLCTRFFGNAIRRVYPSRNSSNYLRNKQNNNSNMFSQEHVLYKKKIRRQDYLVILAQIMIIIVLIVIWQLLVDFKVLQFIYFI